MPGAQADGTIGVIVLGPEQSGKTTLVFQLRELAASDGANVLDGTQISGIAPTTGQERDELVFSARYRFEGELQDAGIAAERAARRAGPPAASTHPLAPDGDDAPPGTVPVDDTPEASMRPQRSGKDLKDDAHHHVAPAPLLSPTLEAPVSLLMKEAGGRMMSTWARYIAAPDLDRALIYVVDVSNPSQLPTAAVQFYTLLADDGLLEHQWCVLVAFNKARSASSVPVEDASQLMGVPQLLRAHPELDMTVVAIDTWTGEGLDQVVRWLARLRPHAPPQPDAQ